MVDAHLVGLTLTWAMCTIASGSRSKNQQNTENLLQVRELGPAIPGILTTYEVLPITIRTATRPRTYPLHAIPQQEQRRCATRRSYRNVELLTCRLSRETDHAGGKRACKRPLHRLSRCTSRGILHPPPVRPSIQCSKQDDIFVCCK